MPRKKIKTRRKKIDKFKDSDADGLPDILEKKLGTNPKKADSDHDGVGDYEEVNIYRTDPLDPDTDKDGMKDGEEIKKGRNPRGAGMLKDLFIPHEGNNYEPRALHPYRLLFYALSSILFKVILIGAVLILPMEAWLTPDILAEQSRKIIELTNIIRKNLKLTPLAESPLLNQAAEEKAQDMLLKQYFSHTGPDKKTLADWLKQIKYSFSVAGENLAIGFTSPEEVVNGWTRSPTHYQNMIDSDFKEIGVGIASGLYENIGTTLVAQYFASPPRPVKAESVINESFTEKTKEISAPDPAVSKTLGEKTEESTLITASPDNLPNISQENPIAILLIDEERSKLYVYEQPDLGDNIVRAEIYLDSGAANARVNFNNYAIDLKEEEPGKWVGETIIFKESEEQIFKPAVLPTVTVEDLSGHKISADLKWENIKPANAALLKQYYFIKQHQSPYIKPLFDATSLFYKIILTLALIALSLNIFIKIKKQKPHIIISTLGLIWLLIVLIII